MYGLPKNFEGAQLVGHSLWQICFGKYQIQLHFDKELSIAVTSELSYQKSLDSNPLTIDFPVAPQSDLMQLLHHSIVNAFGDDEGTLTLEFDNGHIVRCFDQSHYEAYQIKQGNQEIIV
jgi:hypothetical protein